MALPHIVIRGPKPTSALASQLVASGIITVEEKREELEILPPALNASVLSGPKMADITSASGMLELIRWLHLAVREWAMWESEYLVSVNVFATWYLS